MESTQTIKDILYIYCKSMAIKALYDISLIEDGISTEPSEEYIQTFIDRFTTNTHLGYSHHHLVISRESMQLDIPTSQEHLDLEIEPGIWAYRSNIKDGYIEFMSCGDNRMARKKAKHYIKHSRKSGLYDRLGIIDTRARTIQEIKGIRELETMKAVRELSNLEEGREDSRPGSWRV